MPTRNTRSAQATRTGKSATQRRTRPAPVLEEMTPPRKPGRPAAKAAPARKPTNKPVSRAPRAQDVSQYATKDPTPYHKAFATWIVKHVGYNPSKAESPREAFLMGVSIATAARPAFTDSDYLAEWRERTGEAKRGPKPQAEKARRSNRAVVADDEYEADEEDDDIPEDEETDSFEDDDADDSEDDDSDEDGDEWDDDEDDDSEEDDDSDDADSFEDEPAPAPRRAKAAPAKAAPVKRAVGKATANRSGSTSSRGATPRTKAAPAKGRRSVKTVDDGDFVF